MRKRLVLMIVLMLVLALWTGRGWSRTGMLSWNANSEPNLAGYKVYRASRAFDSVSEAELVGTVLKGVTSYETIDVGEGPLFWRISAFNDGGFESGLSNMVSNVGPNIPGGLKISVNVEVVIDGP